MTCSRPLAGSAVDMRFAIDALSPWHERQSDAADTCRDGACAARHFTSPHNAMNGRIGDSSCKPRTLLCRTSPVRCALSEAIPAPRNRPATGLVSPGLVAPHADGTPPVTPSGPAFSASSASRPDKPASRQRRSYELTCSNPPCEREFSSGFKTVLGAGWGGVPTPPASASYCSCHFLQWRFFLRFGFVHPSRALAILHAVVEIVQDAACAADLLGIGR